MNLFNEFESEDERVKYFETELLPTIAFNYDVSKPNGNAPVYKVVDTPIGNVTIYAKAGRIQHNGRWEDDFQFEKIKKHLCN